MNLNSLVAGGVVVSLGCGAFAGPISELHWDLDQVDTRVTTGGAAEFDDMFTGTLTASLDSNAFLAGMLYNIGGNKLSRDVLSSEFFFKMVMVFDTGKLTGGTVKIGDDPTEDVGNVYSALLGSVTAKNITDLGTDFDSDGDSDSFNLFGITVLGDFTTDSDWFTTGGDPAGPVVVSIWSLLGSNISGDFQDIRFDTTGDAGEAQIDPNTDVELFVMIPLPGAASMAGLGILGLVVRRRR